MVVVVANVLALNRFSAFRLMSLQISDRDHERGVAIILVSILVTGISRIMVVLCCVSAMNILQTWLKMASL